MNARSLNKSGRWRVAVRTGWAMMSHSRLRFAGTLLGVVFAVVLVCQALGTLMGLLDKSVMFVRNTRADLWIVPRGVEIFGVGRPISIAALSVARGTPGVDRAEPLIVSGSTVTRPDGGAEQLFVVGVQAPYDLGGPWNLVVGDRSVLSQPDTVIHEDTYRENFGGLNLGGVREIAGRRVITGAFTWGLATFQGPFCFADYTLAREMTGTPADRTSMVLVTAAPAVRREVQTRLQERLPDCWVLTQQEFIARCFRAMLTRTPIGATFGAISVFGLLVGAVVVSLAMFTAVIDLTREFGTLKAIGMSMPDLSTLILAQGVIYGVIGSIVGLGLTTLVVGGMRSPKLALVVPPWLVGICVPLMIGMCCMAAALTLLRLRRVEPAIVFQ
jgi:putative ABC transport system permease protein